MGPGERCKTVCDSEARFNPEIGEPQKWLRGQVTYEQNCPRFRISPDRAARLAFCSLRSHLTDLRRAAWSAVQNSEEAIAYWSGRLYLLVDIL